MTKDKRDLNKEALRLLRDGPDPDPYHFSPTELFLKPEDFQNLLNVFESVEDSWGVSKSKSKPNTAWDVIMTGVVKL